MATQIGRETDRPRNKMPGLKNINNQMLSHKIRKQSKDGSPFNILNVPNSKIHPLKSNSLPVITKRKKNNKQ